MAYLYRHIRLDKNEPFYIGIGSDKNHKRAHSTKQRSYFWGRVVINAGRNYRVDIILDDLPWEEIAEKEKEFIKLYGRRDLGTGILCNMTDGGEGAYGRSPSEQTRKKISENVTKNSHWKNGRKHTLEARKKIAAAGIGRKLSLDNIQKLRKANSNRIVSKETRLKMSVVRKGRIPWNKGIKSPYVTVISPEHRKKISESLKGHSVSQETRNKISIAHTGRKFSEERIQSMRGRIVSDGTRKKLSEIHKGSTKSPETRKRMSIARRKEVNYGDT